MATATLPLLWKGHGGRTYVPVRGARVRHGRVAAVRKVHAIGAPSAPGEPDAETALALKLWTEGGERSLDQLQREIRTLQQAASASGGPIAPRVVDLVGEPAVVGVVMEWCPANLEDWWQRTLPEADAFGRLMAVLAEVARQVGAWHQHALGRGGIEVAHGDLKPSNVLLSATGAWLLSDFGAPPVDRPDDSPWADSDAIPSGGAFLCPELRFHANLAQPVAVDVWALGAIAFALLRMRRLALDGAPIPRVGASSLRFATQRAEQVLEVYRDAPTRFYEKPLDASAFPSPDRLPEADRSAVREALRGAFGEEREEPEAELAEAVLKVLDRALAILPERRFPDADTLAAAFEGLARQWIGLAARLQEAGGASPVQAAAVEAVLVERDVARARAAALAVEVGALQERVDALAVALHAEQQRPPVEIPVEVPVAAAPAGPDRTLHVLVGLGLVAAMQLATLTGTVLLVVLIALLLAG